MMEQIKINLAKYINKKSNELRPLVDLTIKENYNKISSLIADILMLNEPLKKPWNFDNNSLETRLIMAWFCRSKDVFDKTAKEMNNENLSFGKNLYICGVKGSGKSSTIHAMNELIKYFIPAEKHEFKYVEQNKIANTFEIESNINKYTYNEVPGKFEGKPLNIILDDLKFNGLTKSFGTDFIDIIIRFLYDRYSIWLFGGANTIITSLLTPADLKKHIPADLYNRFQHQYNIINFKGTERNV